MRQKRWQLFALVGSLIVVATLVVAVVVVPRANAASSTIVKVTSNDVSPTGAWSYADTRNHEGSGGTGTGIFMAGPLTPPYGRGSFQLNTTINSDKVQLLTDRYDHTPLASIDGIGYQTYRDPASTGSTGTVAGLNIRADLNGDGTTDAYMVYEPYQDQGTAAVQTGVWQAWDAYRGGQAKWWISGVWGTTSDCGQSVYPLCTWSTILTKYPNATIREGTDGFRGSFGVNQGTYNPNIISNVDGLRLSVSGNETIFNFEPLTGPPTSMDQCKNGGWKTFDNPPFKNQGDCVSYVETGGK